MEIRINGESKRINPELTIAELLVELDISQKLIAVALNGVVVRRRELDQVQIVAYDEIEIVRAVGGG
ncbi:MAG: thiamine biosynthesis protein ThiS [Dehalococcoidia bacterium]|nr:thiamine biosynthesis protein ThiS [Dehalococcoidia bacterium]MQG16471.1 sulfur carrier protein ThiS [SAR202 cluster bacterium]